MATQSSKQEADNNLTIITKSITIILIVITIVLLLANLAVDYIKFHQETSRFGNFIELFDMDHELSVPSIFSVFLLFSIFLLTLIISLLKIGEKAPHVAGWVILAFGFLVMTFDEGASIHERFMRPIHLLLMYVNIPSIFYFTWVIPAIILVVLLALVYLKFIIDLPDKTRWLLLLSAVIYLGGAIGIELIAGYFVGKFGTDNLGFNILAAIEEVMEMSGLILFIHTLLTYISRQYKKIQFIFS